HRPDRARRKEERAGLLRRAARQAQAGRPAAQPLHHPAAQRRAADEAGRGDQPLRLPRRRAGGAGLAAGEDERRRLRDPPPGEPPRALRAHPAGVVRQPGPQLRRRGARGRRGYRPGVAAVHGRLRAGLREERGAAPPDPRGEAGRHRRAHAAPPVVLLTGRSQPERGAAAPSRRTALRARPAGPRAGPVLCTAPPRGPRRPAATRRGGAAEAGAGEAGRVGDHGGMPEEPQDERRRAAVLAIEIIDAYVRSDRGALAEAAARVEEEGAVDPVTSELRVFTAFLTRRVQETGVVYKPADSLEAVAAAVADMLPPELEFAVVTVWEAYSVGEEEAAERLSHGDPMVAVHMLAAFCAAVGRAVYRP